MSDPQMHTVEARAHGWRLDHYLTRLYPNFSRAAMQKAVSDGGVTVNGLQVKPSRRLRVNDRLGVVLPEVPDEGIAAEELPISIVYEDEDLVVLNKQAGMIVHPGRGNPNGTLAAALQFHFDQLSDAAGQHRPGIVHRLDRDTTGVIVVAKDNQTHHRLSAQFEQRTVEKIYLAIIAGNPEFDSDWIETHIRTHPKQREKMQVCSEGGDAREATTFYEVVERFAGFALMRLFPKTGRTHQLRVHMRHIRHPIIADKQYGGSPLTLADLDSESDESDVSLITRQALHAHRLSFDHPSSGERMSFEAELPDDMQNTVDALRQYRSLGQ